MTTTPRRLAKPPAKIMPTAEEVVTLIEAGEYDADLRLIARACFGRREVMTGTPHVIPDPDPQLVEPNGATPKRRVRKPVKTDDKLPLNDMPKMFDILQNVTPQAGKVKPLDKYARTDEETFVYANRKFLKSDLIGKVIKFPLDTPKALQGTLVGIVGIGPYKIKLLLISKPSTYQGKYQEHFKNREPLWFSKNDLMEHLSAI